MQLQFRQERFALDYFPVLSSWPLSMGGPLLLSSSLVGDISSND